MTTLAQSLSEIKKPWKWVALGSLGLLIWAAIAVPSLHRASQDQLLRLETARDSAPLYSAAPVESRPVAGLADVEKVAASLPAPEVPIYRRMIRTCSLAMVVQRPTEVADKIVALAESLGGYLETSNGGGQNATYATLTIRVPANRFERARAEVRKLGLNVETEKVDAQDVTRQYVDQEASIRNLKAEEAQYLTILKQATTVKDMMLVSEQLSQVRGRIEQQQAEFNALSHQVETVSIAISLRTESEAQVLGLNWRPGYRLKLALRDGLESVADYATAMTTVLFYVPATLLWVGTILIGVIACWRILRWIGKRWFETKPAPAAQG